MTVLGLKGGMDRVAVLIAQAVEERRELGIQVTRIKTRGIGGICRGSFVFTAALLRFWYAARRGDVDVLERRLGDDVDFICGHGPGSSIGHERMTNPFLAGAM